MQTKNLFRTFSLLALAACLTFLCAPRVRAQDTEGQSSSATPLKKDAPDLEVQLHLLIASNKASEGARVPASLDTTIKQLRNELPLSNYRLGATFLHRVKSGRPLEVKGTGGLVQFGPAVPSPGAVSSNSPTFYQFTLAPVEMKVNEAGQPVVSINNFRIGMRVPIVTSQVSSGNSSTGGFPVIQYEDTGITTGLSVREGEPVVVGTLYVGPEGEAVIVILTARRIPIR